jgi:hypothetical protein
LAKKHAQQLIVYQSQLKPMARSSNANKKVEDVDTSQADIYLTDDSAKTITLSIRIGPAGQKAASNVKLEQNLLLHGHDGTLRDFNIDTNRNCKNKFLSAATIVTAMSDVEEINVVYIINGGPDGKKEIPLRSGAVNEGDFVTFDITVFLF